MSLRLSEGLGVNAHGSRADEFVVFAMCADPEPVHAVFARQAQSSVVKAYPHAVHLAAAEQFEL